MTNREEKRQALSSPRALRCRIRLSAMLGASCLAAFVLVMALGASAVASFAATEDHGAEGSPTAAADSTSDSTFGERSQDQDSGQGSSADPQNRLAIDAAELPPAYPQLPYHFRFSVHGNYVPVLHWKVESGALPPGVTLADDGTLHGVAQRTGEFQFVVAVKDGNQPRQAVQKPFVIKVLDGLTVAWKAPARVNNDRIEGSVEVTNMTPEDMDLTFDTKAVAENGRATEIGYQHFPLRRGTIGMLLPFGETLPNGGYVVYVTVVGEVAARHAIYRQLLQTPGPLHVDVEP
jgi:hypothetical protein